MNPSMRSLSWIAWAVATAVWMLFAPLVIAGAVTAYLLRP